MFFNPLSKENRRWKGMKKWMADDEWNEKVAPWNFLFSPVEKIGGNIFRQDGILAQHTAHNTQHSSSKYETTIRELGLSGSFLWGNSSKLHACIGDTSNTGMSNICVLESAMHASSSNFLTEKFLTGRLPDQKRSRRNCYMMKAYM